MKNVNHYKFAAFFVALFFLLSTNGCHSRNEDMIPQAKENQSIKLDELSEAEKELYLAALDALSIDPDKEINPGLLIERLLEHRPLLEIADIMTSQK